MSVDVFRTSNFSDVVVNEDRLGSTVIEVVVGVVIGVCGVAVVAVAFVFWMLHMFVRRDQVQDLDAVEYSIQEEYEARINFEALQNMDPNIRARIDFDLLGQLTNTSPDLLAPFKQTDSTSTGRDGSLDAGCKASSASHMTRTSSIQSINHISLKLTKSDCPPDDDRSNYNHNNKCMATPERLRRTNTISDINSCIPLDENMTTVAPVKFVVRREGDEKTEELKKDFLVVVAGSLLAGTSLTELANQRVSPGGSISWDRPRKQDVCPLDPAVGSGATPATFKWRKHSICLDKTMSTAELKEMKMLCRRECASEGSCGEDRGKEATHQWGTDFNLGEECFAEIERRRVSQQETQLQEGVAADAFDDDACLTSTSGKAVEDGASS